MRHGKVVGAGDESEFKVDGRRWEERVPLPWNVRRDWHNFATKLKQFVLDGAKMGALEIASMQGKEKMVGGEGSRSRVKVSVHERGARANIGVDGANAAKEDLSSSIF